MHSEHSPDSKTPIEELCRTAIQKGFQEIAITDHFELYALATRSDSLRRVMLKRSWRISSQRRKSLKAS